MKKHFLISILFLFLAPALYSQAPQSIPYQAVVRNIDGSTMANAAVTITFKIHDNSATGTVVYEETHTTTTNAQGLVSLNVGGGVAVTGIFSDIQWGSGSKFLHVLMNAGNWVVDLGTQQMMSVPYALYAEDVNVRVSVTGDSLFIGDQVSIVPGVSAANPFSLSNYGSVLLPGNTTCQNEFISVTGCGGQDSLLYYDRYYSLVEIGGQCWFAENLATDKYANGDNIPTGLTNTQWQNTTSGAYAYYDDNVSNNQIHGKLYNWYVVNDSREVCPNGWHVSTDCDWMYLEGFLGMTVEQQEQSGFRGNNEGAAIKLQSASDTEATNSTGFSATLGGFKNFDGGYANSMYGHWWTSSSLQNSQAILRRVVYLNSLIDRYATGYNNGFSIRCIKD